MKAFLRFIVLAALGFVLGAAFAVFQSRGHLPAATVISQTKPTPAPVAAQTAMPGVQVGGAFSLVDHTGKPVTEKSWPGKYKLVFFGFTHCPDTCPATLQKLASVMEHYDAKGDKIVPLFITVDPLRDTAAVLSKYVGGFSPVIVGLTGTEAQIKDVEMAYKIYVAKQPGKMNDDYLEDHSAYIYLMSADDKLLQTFNVDETAEAIISKIKESVK